LRDSLGNGTFVIVFRTSLAEAFLTIARNSIFFLMRKKAETVTASRQPARW